MAFTADEKLIISEILGIYPPVLDAQITLLGADLTANVITAVQTQLTRWTTAGVNFVRIEPKERNFGARIDPLLDQADIRRKISLLLQFPQPEYSMGMGTLQIGN